MSTYILRKGVAQLSNLVDGGAAMSGSVANRYLFVDVNNGSDSNDGTSLDQAYATIEKAFDMCKTANGGQSGDIVFIMPGTYEEDVSILDYSAYASYVRVIGQGSRGTVPGVYWASDDGASSNCLIAGAVGWSFENIRFACPSAAAAVVVPCTQGTGWSSAIGIRTQFVDCYFDGLTTGLYGIDLHGAPYNVEIRNCKFAFIQNSSNNAYAIVSTNTSYADAYRAVIDGCWFHECDNFIDASLNVSRITNCYFQESGAYAATTIIDLRSGTRGENCVSGNVFDGGADYSNTGGFYANASTPGNWTGNICSDTAETEVGDNGFTLSAPAA